MTWLPASSFKTLCHQQAVCGKQTQQNKAKFAFNMTLTIRGELFALPRMICCCSDEVCQKDVFLPFSFLCTSARRRAAIRLSLSELIFTISGFNEHLQQSSRWLADEQELVCFDHSLSGGLQSWKSR